MIPDPLTFALEALGCREHTGYDTCVEHGGEGWPCNEAVRLATLIEERDRAIRADECEKAAAFDAEAAQWAALMAENAALWAEVGRLSVVADEIDAIVGERDRAHGTAATLEAENARLTEALYLTRITLEATFRVLQEASGLPDDIDDPDCRDEMVLALRPRAEKAEAENARLRAGIERLCSDIDNPLRERHDESPHDLPEVAEDLRALLADTDSAQDEGGE